MTFVGTSTYLPERYFDEIPHWPIFNGFCLEDDLPVAEFDVEELEVSSILVDGFSKLLETWELLFDTSLSLLFSKDSTIIFLS